MQALAVPATLAEAVTPTAVLVRIPAANDIGHVEPGDSVLVRFGSDTRGIRLSLAGATGVGEFRFLMRSATLRRVVGGHPVHGMRVQVTDPLAGMRMDWQRPAVLVAAGLGIAPFLSHLESAAVAATQMPACVLLYGSSSPEEVALHHRLLELAAALPWLTVRFTVSRPSLSWQGGRGRIDATLVAGVLERHPDALVYPAGPLPFLRRLHAGLVALGLRADRIQPDRALAHLIRLEGELV